MAEYIEKETLDSELYNRFHDEDEPSNITDVRLGSVRNFVRDFPTVDVVEREKIEQAIAEIKDGYYGNEEKSETDSERADAFNNGLNYALEILKRNIGE